MLHPQQVRHNEDTHSHTNDISLVVECGLEDKCTDSEHNTRHFKHKKGNIDSSNRNCVVINYCSNNNNCISFCTDTAL